MLLVGSALHVGPLTRDTLLPYLEESAAIVPAPSSNFQYLTSPLSIVTFWKTTLPLNVSLESLEVRYVPVDVVAEPFTTSEPETVSPFVLIVSVPRTSRSCVFTRPPGVNVDPAQTRTSMFRAARRAAPPSSISYTAEMSLSPLPSSVARCVFVTVPPVAFLRIR